MGRETKLLLGLLATLLGVFLGVLSMKLLVPRPPAGTGPDVHADIASAEPHDLVEPPRFDDPHATRGSSAAAGVELEPTADDSGEPAAATARTDVVRDPFVSRSAFTPPEPRSGGDLPAAPAELSAPATAPMAVPARSEPFAPTVTPVGAAAAAPSMAGSHYVARHGDSWWSLAETVYGDGRFYRALFAWNRAVDPRVSLVPGTPLELPPQERLRTAWPALVPAP
jgi:nucleoid-associated protein YgaU